MPNLSDHKVLTVPEVAKALRVSEWSVYELIKRGELRPVRIGRAFRISVRSLDDFLNKTEQTS